MYRTIETSVWFDLKFKGLPAPGKLLFLYLITNPHAHVSGIYYLPEEVVRQESGIKTESIDTLWDTLSGSELAYRDRLLQIVWVKNMLRHQGGHKKLVAAAANHIKTLHNSELVKRFAEYYPAVRKLAGKPKGHRVSDSGPTCLKEQEQEQEIESGVNATARDEGSERRPTPTRSEKVSGNGRRRSEQTGDHAELIRHFEAGWKARYGADYPLKRGKDHTHASWILEKSKGDLAKAKLAVDAFFRDDDPKTISKKHPLGWLVSGFQQYVHTPGGNGAARTLTAAQIYDI